MRRIATSPRAGWEEIARKHGFNFHHVNGELYWDESAYYSFTLAQIEDGLEDPANELYAMCLDLVGDACRDEEILRKLRIPPEFWDYVARSAARPDFSLYGRFDFSYDGKNPAKLLEFNADTPTSLYESAYFQWIWLEDMISAKNLPEDADQFNSIQEKILAAFSSLAPRGMHFACMQNSEEDRATVGYLMDCAVQSGISSKFIYMEDIGEYGGVFYDLDNEPINTLFKLYPWEYIWGDAFGRAVVSSSTQFIEPPWKMLLSNKGILPLLWERHRDHPNLLPAWFDDGRFHGGSWIKKPLLSREGANISIMGGRNPVSTPGEYGAEGFVGQEFWPLPDFDGNRPVCGVWIADGQACGLGIREDKSAITTDASRFLPHVISG